MKQLTIFFILISFSLISLANPATKYFEKGENATNNTEKVKLFSISLRIAPDFAPSLFKRAEAFYHSNDMKNADKDLKQYLSLHGPDIYYHALKGKVYQKKGMFKRALDAYDEALKINSNFDDASYHKGILLITLGGIKRRPKYYKEAVTYLKNVSSSYKFYKIALSQAAQCLEYESDHDNVLSIYRTLTNTNSTNSAFYFNLGRILYFKEQYQESFDALNKACELTFQDSTFNEFYGIFRYILAKHFLKESVSADYHLNLYLEKLPQKTLLSKLFNKEIKVEQFLEESLKDIEQRRFPTNLKARYEGNLYCQIGYYYMAEKQQDKSIEYFAKSEQLKSFGAHFYYLAKYESQRLKIEKKNDIKI